MMEEDNSIIDLVEDSPSPVFHNKKSRIGSNLSSKRTLLSQGSSSSLETSFPPTDAPMCSNRSSSPVFATLSNRSTKSPDKDSVNKLPLPGASNFAEERAKAIRKKKQKDKTSPFKLPKHASSDFVKSSTLLASPSYQASKTYSTQTIAQNNPSFSSTSSSTITQPHKRKSNDSSPAKTAWVSPTKFRIHRDRVIGWPSSSDSSSNDEDLVSNQMVFKTKRIKHRHGSKSSQSSGSSHALNSLSNCNHMDHAATNIHGHVTQKSDSNTALCKSTLRTSKLCGKKRYSTDQELQIKVKKKKTSTETSNAALLGNRPDTDESITSHKHQAGTSLFKSGSAKHYPNGTVKSKTQSTSTNRPTLNISTSPSAIASKSSTSDLSKSPCTVSKSSVPNSHRSPSLDRHANSGVNCASPTFSRNNNASRSCSPYVNRTNLSSNLQTPPRINLFNPPSPIFTPPSILGYSPSENHTSTSNTSERGRNAISRFHPYNTIRLSNISPIRQPSVNQHRKNEANSGSCAETGSISHRRNGQIRTPEHSTENLVVVDLTTTPETSNAVKLIRQMEKDEEMARKLQEELDKEFALTLAQQQEGTHQASRSPTGTPYHNIPDAASGTVTPPRHRSTRGQSGSGARGHDPNFNLAQFGWTSGEEGFAEGFNPLNLDGIVDIVTRPRRGVSGNRNRRAQGIDENQMDQLMEELHAGIEVGDMLRTVLQPPPRPRRARHFVRHHTTPDRSGNDYDELLRLGEMLGEARKKGLSATEMNRLPTLMYKQSDNPNQDVECNICMCNYEEGDTQKILPCFHSYHSTCIDKWIAKNASCPVCRVEIKLG